MGHSYQPAHRVEVKAKNPLTGVKVQVSGLGYGVDQIRHFGKVGEASLERFVHSMNRMLIHEPSPAVITFAKLIRQQDEQVIAEYTLPLFTV